MRVTATRNRGKIARDQSTHPKVLVYGFRPYLQFATNITAEVIKTLAPREGLKTVVLPVRFHKAQFVAAIKKHKPDIILGLGQCPSGTRFRIERRALNHKCQAKGNTPVAIAAAGPEQLTTTLRLKAGPRARESRNAGSYVCNYSMYVMLDYLRRNHLPTRFGFIHIPCGLSRNRTTKYLESVLNQLQASVSPSSGRRKC